MKSRLATARAAKTVANLLGVILLTLVVGFQYLRGSLPQLSGRIALPGLAHSVEVIRDRHGVPHIYAADQLDANFALGFVHAQDRLWQMEMNRRIAAGRLSELFGPSALEKDKFLRTLGVRRAAEANYPRLDLATRQVLDAYAAGVNAFLTTNSRPLPPEFLLLGFKPEPWTPADSIAWLKMLSWDLSRNWRDELARIQLGKRLTSAQIAEFLAPYPGDPPVRLPDLSALTQAFADTATELMAQSPVPAEQVLGSNNWAISGARTDTGSPLLANDPHLGLTAPSLWYFAHLQIGDRPLFGATIPSLPMALLARNDRIAWGFTNTAPDVQDLFIEKMVPGEDGAYFTPEGKRKFETRSEVIRVKDAPDVTLRVRVSRHGPVISDVVPSASKLISEGFVLALQWTTLREDDLTMEALAKTGLARNWDEFLEGMKNFHSPQQNVVYADVDGNVGFVAPGRVPIRRADNDLKGLVPSPGWDAKYDWQDFIPFDRLPRSFNPSLGRIATANDKITPRSYPYWITSEWAPPFRVRRIDELLDATARHSVASFARMQADTRSLYLRDILPLMLSAPAADARAARAIELLKHWDYDMVLARPEPLIATAWLREFTRLVYADELGELFPAFWGERPLFMLNVLRDADGQSRWCDDIRTPEKETCGMMASRALDLALRDVAARFGPDMEKWRWQDAHVAISEHRPLGQQPLLAALFNISVPMPGGTWTVNVGRIRLSDAAHPFFTDHAATLRAIYDFADLDRSVFMHSTGQSGNVFSPFYSDLVKPWSRVEYLPMTTHRDEIERNQVGTLILVPQKRK